MASTSCRTWFASCCLLLLLSSFKDLDSLGGLNITLKETSNGQLLSVFGEFGIGLFVVN